MHILYIHNYIHQGTMGPPSSSYLYLLDHFLPITPPPFLNPTTKFNTSKKNKKIIQIDSNYLPNCPYPCSMNQCLYLWCIYYIVGMYIYWWYQYTLIVSITNWISLLIKTLSLHPLSHQCGLWGVAPASAPHNQFWNLPLTPLRQSERQVFYHFSLLSL